MIRIVALSLLVMAFLPAAAEQSSPDQELRLRVASFDPVAENLRSGPAADRSEIRSRYAIVQFDSDRATAAMRELRDQGVLFYGYIPDGAYIVRWDSTAAALLGSERSVRWLGEYRAAWKADPHLVSQAERQNEIVVIPFRGESLERTALGVEKFSRAFRTAMIDDGALPRLRYAVDPSDRRAFLDHVSQIDAVMWIEPHVEMVHHNDVASQIIQGNEISDDARRLFARNLTGTGQIIAVADSGADIDACWFTHLNGVSAITEAENTDQPALGQLFPDRKVIGYWVQRNADAYDDNETCGGGPATGFHGTHTAGTALGDNFANPSSPTDPGIDIGDGMAPNAQLLFQDVGAANGCLNGTNDLFNTFLQAWEAGARTHSDSYGGGSTGTYNSVDFIVDQFLFRHEEMSIFTSAGNAGPGPSTTSSPANAKNIVAVGALGSAGDRTGAASFSSRGPTEDGRVKPDIVAPGSSIRSAGGNAIFGDENCGTRTLSGTSMAAPVVAGGSALIRQYFEEGRYPTGEKNPADSIELTAPLVKAILLNGTRPLPEGGEFGGRIFGWGRAFLDSNLFFPGDSREMRIWGLRNEAGLIQGQQRTFKVTTSGDEELRVTLVWSDPEASLPAEPALVNDLDLVVSNGNETFVANTFDASGFSVPDGNPDRINNVEQVRIAAPAPGEWTITVRAERVPGNGLFLTDRQGFALVASHRACETAVALAPQRLSASSNPVMGVDLRWETAPGSAVTQIYRAPIEDPANLHWVGSSTNGFFNDMTVQRGETFIYVVRGADGCGEGPPSSSVAATANSGCDLRPQFAGASAALDASPSCAIVLEWDPAELRCAQGDAIVYNIYRSTDPDFVPATGAIPYASVEDKTQFIDIAVASGVRYTYLVRAEDLSARGSGPNGGTQDRNLRRVSAVTSGPSTSFGTWTDDAGDTSSLLNGEPPWHVTEQKAHESQFAYFAGVDGSSYPHDTCASLTTPPLELGAAPVLTYWAAYDFEINFDGVVVEISVDGGATWEDLPPDGGYPATLSQTGRPPINACGYLPPQGAFTGPTGFQIRDWIEFTSDLSAYANQQVRIRWRLTTDPALAEEGFYLDDISVTDVGVPGDCLPVALEPEAAFTQKPITPLSGAPVAFEDLSAFAPTSWLWDFGDGETSTSRNPQHTYLEPGTYVVSLTVTNSAGSDTETRTLQVFDNALTYEVQAVTPGQARAEGAQSSFFKTSFWATNPSPRETTLRLRYLATPIDADGGAEESVIFALEPNESLAFTDVLTEAFRAGTNTAGAVVVEVPTGFDIPIVTSRTYNEPSPFAGTSGQYIPSVLLEQDQPTVAVISGLGGDTAFRSNVGVANLEAITIEATLRVLDATTGQPIGQPIRIDVPPYASVQVNGVNQRAGLGNLPLFGVSIEGTGKLFAYASKLDNVTSDPTYIPSTLEPKIRQWTDGVGAIPGGGGTFFRSNLSIYNPGSSAANLTIDYTTRGSSAPVASTEVVIDPGETRFFADAVTELFPQIGGVGMFEYTSDQPLTIWVRTFNDRDLAGTLGQFIPAFGTADLVPAQGAILQGLSENSGFRTNAGIVNVGPGDHEMTIQVWRTDGTLAGSKTYSVRSGEARAISRVFSDVVPGIDIADGYLRLIPSAGGTMYVWASSVDNRSTDQTFVRPIPIE